MPQNDSWSSGDLLNSIPDYGIWKSNEEGFCCGQEMFDEPDHILAMEYLEENKFFGLPSSAFVHGRDCYYKTNHCHIENRRGARFIRPSRCSKFMLQSGEDIIKEQLQDGNPKQKWLPTYHGTHPSNLASILQHGLVSSGTAVDAGVVKSVHGSAYGKGVYTSMMPLYAQLYAAPDFWRGKYYVQTFLMLCQSPETISVNGTAGGTTKGLIDRNDVHKLYGGFVGENEVQYMTTDPKDFVMCAIMIKIHHIKPNQPGGEFYEVKEVLEKIDAAAATAKSSVGGTKGKVTAT